MEEWQDLALNNRRIPHGRLGKRGKGGRAATFDPKNAIGTYSLDLRPSKKPSTSDSAGILELHGFDETERGLFATFRTGDILEGAMLLAGSRKVLKQVVQEAEQEKSSADGDEEENETGPADEMRGDDDQADDDNQAGETDANDIAEEDLSTASEDEIDREDRRAAAFEKNSFRSPKFWVQWRGRLGSQSSQPGDLHAVEGGSAYLVFSKNNCESFTGTISSTELGWDNISFKGRKLKSTTKRTGLEWSDFMV